jgi:Ca-activated chloride channel family protein
MMLSNWNILVWEYEFYSPHWLWLLCLVPFWALLMWRSEKKRTGTVNFSRNIDDQRILKSLRISRLRIGIITSYCFVTALLILAISKPFHWSVNDDFSEEYKNGIEIILAMDVSMSMYARDFEPNRLEASKAVAKEFVDRRRADRIGLVVYAGEAYTACPTTLDHEILKEQIDQINGEHIDGGTAIGTGLGTAVARLRNDSLPSKVIILLTDGSNNSGEISPEMAAELAHAKNIRVYTIGVGSNGEALSPVITPFGVRFERVPVEIDEVTLTKIAQATNGRYFRATDERALKDIYLEIEKLEKQKMVDQHYKAEPPSMPQAFLNWAFVLMLITWSTQNLLFKNND